MAVIRPAVRRLFPNDVRAKVHFALVGGKWTSQAFTRLDPALRMTAVTSQTKLVMDGYPRSGNTYARASFLYANGVDTVVSTHRHSPRSIEAGLKRKLPCIVLIRPPRGALASVLQYDDAGKFATAVHLYRWFYKSILPYADEVLIATFEEVTSDMGTVIRRCNARFGSNFVPYEKTPEAEQKVNEMIDAGAALHFKGDAHTMSTGRPSAARASTEEVLARLDSTSLAAIDGLEEVYDEVLRHHRD